MVNEISHAIQFRSELRLQKTLDNQTRQVDCKFCHIVGHSMEAVIIFEDEVTQTFLDKRPLFPGHCLVVPVEHHETLGDMPQQLVGRLFERVQIVSIAVERGMNAGGTFVAINNRVSQSVPHLHIHVVPRKPKDGLKGFFWPRQKYSSHEEELRVRDAIRREIEKLSDERAKSSVVSPNNHPADLNRQE